MTLPTGGKFKYFWEGGLGFGSSILTRDESSIILPRVNKRKSYPDGSTMEGYEEFTKQEFFLSPEYRTSSTIEHRNSSGQRLAKEVHYYYGSAIHNEDYTDPTAYPRWKAGKEYKTEQYDTDGTTVLRTNTQTWAQRPVEPGEINWWSRWAETAHPANDPRVEESITTLEDQQTGSKVEYDYDRYNNRTNVREFDYRTPFGSLVRETVTSFMTTEFGPNYQTDL